MKKEQKLHITLIIFFIGFFLGAGTSLVFSAEDASFTYLDHFHAVYQTIKLRYVEETNAKELFYGAINGMIESLGDPYSRFLSEEEYKEFSESVTGQFVGIGVEITIKGNEVIIVSPISESPAEKAGILSGDKIIKINDTVLEEDNITKVLKKIKGQEGSTVKITIEREGFSEPLDLEVERKAIKLTEVKYGMLNELKNTGYLKITNFYDDTHIDVRKALVDLKNMGMKSLILDLRNNPGGNLEACVQIVDLFLDTGKVIVTTRGREGSGINEEYKSQNPPVYNDEILVLVNNGSASASEVLAGALKDQNAAEIAGEQTFGKALVQQILDIEKGKTAYALTIRKYYTPAGNMIHKKGITPTYVIKQELIPEEDRKNLGRILNDKLIVTFAKNNPEYSQQNIDKLVQYLSSKQLPISKRVASFYYKNEVNRDKPSKLYDLEFDIQLKESLKFLK
jgi:carboxyl-terminal processing protease